MTAATIITAVCILIAGLFAVIVERTTERDVARDDARQLAEQLDATTARLADVLDEHALCPTPLVPFDSLSKAERAHITNAASAITAASLRPSLHVVEPVDGDAPEADETWLDESPLFRDGDGRWA